MKQPRVEDFDPEAATALKSSLTGMPAIANPLAVDPVSPPPPRVPDRGSIASIPVPDIGIVPEPTQLSSEQASTPASTLASYPATMMESIRKTVKLVGREVSFSRLTPGEKDRLRDILYTFRRQGLKVTENEINRIAVNFLMEDYQAYGRASVLARVLAALLA